MSDLKIFFYFQNYFNVTKVILNFLVSGPVFTLHYIKCLTSFELIEFVTAEIFSKVVFTN